MSKDKQSKTPFQSVRGTHDLIGDDYRRHHQIRDIAHSIAANYGYLPIATPIVEYAGVYQKNLGETSDIVGKEMYTFLDKGGEELSIRPEGTAGVIRAIISNGLTQSMPLKLIYDGPMMRYERPQKGRTRQFHHVGVEFLGTADPLADVETIALGAHILQQLDVLTRTTLEINSLGDPESRNAWRQALVDYFMPYHNDLSQDSQMRLTRNPLRILDSKDPKDQELLVNAPSFTSYMSKLSCEIFEKVCEGLELLQIKYIHNPRIVRGLDYYCHTAFEFTTGELGAQGALIAGGRYDNLVAQMGGPPTPGIGWGLGIERVALMLGDLPPVNRPVAVIATGEDVMAPAFKLAMELRKQGLPIEFTYTGNMGKRLKQANKRNASAAIFIGADELSASQATVRDLNSGEQNLVAFSQLKAYLMDNFTL